MNYECSPYHQETMIRVRRHSQCASPRLEISRQGISEYFELKPGDRVQLIVDDSGSVSVDKRVFALI